MTIEAIGNFQHGEKLPEWAVSALATAEKRRVEQLTEVNPRQVGMTKAEWLINLRSWQDVKELIDNGY